MRNTPPDRARSTASAGFCLKDKVSLTHRDVVAQPHKNLDTDTYLARFIPTTRTEHHVLANRQVDAMRRTGRRSLFWRRAPGCLYCGERSTVRRVRWLFEALGVRVALRGELCAEHEPRAAVIWRLFERRLKQPVGEGSR